LSASCSTLRLDNAFALRVSALRASASGET
jgi:hypothetical protein